LVRFIVGTLPISFSIAGNPAKQQNASSVHISDRHSTGTAAHGGMPEMPKNLDEARAAVLQSSGGSPF